VFLDCFQHNYKNLLKAWSKRTDCLQVTLDCDFAARLNTESVNILLKLLILIDVQKATKGLSLVLADGASLGLAD
jgi:hypothetical protein